MSPPAPAHSAVRAWPAAASLVAASLLGALAPAAGAEPRVEYVVRLERPHTQTVEIELVLRDVGPAPIDVTLPVWRPGRYFVADFAGTIRWLDAIDADARPLSHEKTDKTTWRIDPEGADQVRIRYEIYANSIHDRTRHVDDTHAFLSGSSVFLYKPQRRDEPTRVRIEAPEGWRTATGLEPDPDEPGAFLAPDYDVLIDSPFEIGIHDRIEFEAAGIPHEIVIWGEADYDAERMARDFGAIVENQAAIFGEVPYDRYVFMIHVGPGMRGGTEHLNSTIMQTERARLETLEGYRSFLGLVSHEVFHVWNVKQFRPSGLSPYDYARENYTRLLWLAEGTTSYYDDLTLVRTGLIDRDEYLKRLARYLDGHFAAPGRRVQSLEESSFDAWIKFNRRTPDTWNATGNFYRDGALASLVLDLRIRERTGGDRSLDDVMRVLYERFPIDGPGYTPRDVREAVRWVSGHDFGPFFDAHIAGTEPLDFESALATVGLELHLKPEKGPWDEEAPEMPRPRPALGITLGEEDGRQIVRAVRTDRPAYDAGVIAGDEIIAINGRRLRAPDLEPLLRGAEPGHPVTLTISRYDRIHTLEVVPASEPHGKWSLRPIADASPDQREAYEAWLGIPWDKPDENDAENVP